MKCDYCHRTISKNIFYEWNTCIFCSNYCLKTFAMSLVMQHIKIRKQNILKQNGL